MSKKLIQLIHIGKSKLGLDDETYRALLVRVTGVDSCRRMSAEQLEAVLTEMRAKGFAQAPTGNQPRTLGQRPLMKKIGALLADNQLPWAYAEAIARRQYRKDRLEFCSDAELGSVVAALHRYAKRSKAKPEAQ